jgi:WXG100 family type VII secretion target
MSDGTYSVRMQDIDASAQELRAVTQRIDAIITELESRTEQNLAQWEGSAREFYRLKKKEWDNAVAQMNASAARAALSLNHINESYHNAERRGQSMWS